MSGTDLPFRCTCGAVCGVLLGLSKGDAVRFSCCCDDCQAYAHWLGRGDVLDANGGTDACHADASRLAISAGLDHHAGVKMAAVASRPVLRWYCRDCRLPLFNTYDTAQRPLLGLVLASVEPGTRDGVLGPSTGIIWRKFAVGDASKRKSANILAMIWRLFSRQISARLSGDWRNTPLFDRTTGRPIVTPRILSDAERVVLRQSATDNAGA